MVDGAADGASLASLASCRFQAGDFLDVAIDSQPELHERRAGKGARR